MAWHGIGVGIDIFLVQRSSSRFMTKSPHIFLYSFIAAIRMKVVTVAVVVEATVIVAVTVMAVVVVALVMAIA